MADLKLVDSGAHGIGKNNTKTVTKATPSMVITSPKEFTVSGGSLSSPEVTNAASGLISADTELWLKNSASNVLVKAVVGGVSSTPNSTTTQSSSGAWSGNTGAFTFTGQRIQGTTTKGAIKTATLTGEFNVQFTWAIGSGSGQDNYFVGFFPVSDDATFNSSDEAGGMRSMANSFHISRGSNATKYYKGGTSQATSPSISDGDALTLSRDSSGNITLSRGGSTIYTWTGTYTGDMRLCVGDYGTATYQIDLQSVQWSIVNSYTYTLSSLSPALTGSIGDWTHAYKVRSDRTKAMMSLAVGQTDEPLCKETALTLAGSGTTASQVVATGPTSLLPYFAAGNLSKKFIITVGGTDYEVDPNGTVTESGSGPYTTTIPIATQSSAPTACKIANRYTTVTTINTLSYAAGPQLTLTCDEITLPSDVKRIGLKVRGDTTLGCRCNTVKCGIKEKS